MSTLFPGAIDSFSLKIDSVTDVMAADVNNLQDSVVAIETAVIAQSPNTNILADTLTQDLWTDVADVPDASLITPKWYALWSGNAPDVTGIVASGAMIKAVKNLKITVDTNGTQFGIVAFLPYAQVVQLRGKTLSFSIDVQGSNVSALRMAVLKWTSTADAYTVDVVSSWAATPTWATNWAAINTPANLTVSGSASVPDRLELEGVIIPDDATVNNLAVVVWTPNSENSGDYVVLARAKLEIGQLATAFVGPSLEIEKINSGYLEQGPNLFINGGFDVWQRTTNDTGVTTTRKYVADRWAVKTGAGTLANVQRSTTVRTGARSTYSLEMVGAASVTAVNVDQRILAAMVGRYKRTLYFSGYIYNGSGASFTPKIYVSTPATADVWTTPTIRNGAGSGENLQACADAAWTLVSWTADVSGYTNIGNGLEVRIEIPSGSLVSGDTVRLAEMNLTVGAPGPFEQTIAGLEEILCKRYFQLVGGDYAYHFMGAGHTVNTVSGYTTVLFPQEMRSIPTVTSPTASTLGVMDNDGIIIALTTLSVIHPSRASMLAVIGWSGGVFSGKGQSATMTSNNSTSGKFILEAEL